MLALSCYMNNGVKEVIIFDVYVPNEPLVYD